MKKLFNKIACFAMTAAALAGGITDAYAAETLYLCGANVNGKTNQWTPTSPVTVTLENDMFTFKAKGEFKMSTTKGSWDDFNASARGVTAQNNWTISGNTATAPLAAWGVNTKSPLGWESTEVTYTVDKDLTSITASAGEIAEVKFYLTGFNHWGSWTDEYMFEPQGNNVYKYVAEDGLNGGWKIVGEGYSPEFGSNGSAPEAGVVYNLQAKGSDINTTFTKPCTLTFTYNAGGTSTVLIETEATEVDYTKWYLNIVGAFNDWEDQGVLFSADGMARRENVAVGNNPFKIKIYTGSSDLWYNNSEVLPLDTWTKIDGNTGDGMTISGAVAGEAYNFEYNAKTNEVKVTKAGTPTPPTPPTPPVPAAPENVYICGSLKDNAWAGKQQMMTKAAEGNVWTITETILNNDDTKGYFTFVTNDGADWETISSSDRYGAPADNTAVELGTAMPVTAYMADVDAIAAKSWMIDNGTYDFTFDFDNMTMTASKHDEPEPPVPSAPEKVYLIGNLAAGSWTPGTQIEMAKASEGNIWTLADTEIADAGEGYGYFSFVTNDADVWDPEGETPGINSSDRFGAPANDTEVESGAEMEAVCYAAGVNASSAASWKAEAARYDFTFDYDRMTLKVEKKVSGIVEIGADNEAVEYYSLQGVRVEKPGNGLYIRVRGGKSSKIMVK